MRTNYRDYRPSSESYDHLTFLRALEIAGFGLSNVSASGVQLYNYLGNPMPGTIVPTNIGKDMVFSFQTQINKMGYNNGLIFTRETPEREVVNYGTEVGITFITSPIIEDKIREKRDVIDETLDDFQRLNQNVPMYENKHKFRMLIDEVQKAITNDEKKKTLENLAYYFIQTLGLVPEKNISTSSGELDLLVSNNKLRTFWVGLGTPILVECKNTKDPAGAPDLRIFKHKLGNLKTGLLISWNGVSGQDEFHDAKKIVRDAWVLGKRLIVLQDVDFQEIADGSLPQDVLYKKFLAHWKQYEG